MYVLMRQLRVLTGASIYVSSNTELPVSSVCRQTLERGGAVLLIPGLLAPSVSAIPAADTPALSRLLGASQRLDCLPANDFESLLIACVFAEQNKTCAASLGYAFEFGEATGNILRADPAYQQIDMNNATLAAPGSLTLEASEAEALLLTLNQHFAADGLRFEYKNPDRWYCHFEQPLDIQTTPINAAADRDVAECRPTGDDSRAWRSKLAEIEMLLFEHPVNNDRQLRGLLPVNTLWLWGEGHCAKQAVQVVDFVSDSLYAESLAGHLELSHCSLQQLHKATNSANQTVCALQQLRTATDDAFIQSVKSIDNSLGDILWSQHQSGKVSEILIWCGGDQLFLVQSSVSRISRWFKALQKPKPLSTYMHQAVAEQVD